MSIKVPFLMRFMEREEPAPEPRLTGSMSNPKEESPRPEGTPKGPMGD